MIRSYLVLKLHSYNTRNAMNYSSQFSRINVRKFTIAYQGLACEDIRFSSLVVAEDVSRGGTSATQRQKFPTDDLKSVRNPVRSADWSTQHLHCFSYCL